MNSVEHDLYLEYKKTEKIEFSEKVGPRKCPVLGSSYEVYMPAWKSGGAIHVPVPQNLSWIGIKLP